jgi:hypothetical protein
MIELLERLRIGSDCLQKYPETVVLRIICFSPLVFGCSLEEAQSLKKMTQLFFAVLFQSCKSG